MINLAAFTYEGFVYPSYISFNEVNGKIEITIRSAASKRGAGSMGPTATITLDPSRAKSTLLEVLEHLPD